MARRDLTTAAADTCGHSSQLEDRLARWQARIFRTEGMDVVKACEAVGSQSEASAKNEKNEVFDRLLKDKFVENKKDLVINCAYVPTSGSQLFLCTVKTDWFDGAVRSVKVSLSARHLPIEHSGRRRQ